MPVNVQIRNVPDDVHSVLRRRADAAGQSLQEYLLGELVEHAGKPTSREWVAQIEASLERFGGAELSFAEIADAVHEGRPDAV